MNSEVTIFVELLDEGTKVWCPVRASELGQGMFRISADQSVSDDERWGYGPGELVWCQERTFADGSRGLVATNAVIAGVTDLESLRKAVRFGARPEYVMFWGHQPEANQVVGKGCLSQWWPATFVVDGLEYGSAEHFMMAEKARIFGDAQMRTRILEAPSPADAKSLGREVRGFDQKTWVACRFDVVVRGSLEKFQQNQPLTDYLVGTKDRVLVEASPVDRIWGIGLAADAPGADDPEQWPGLNLLGFALMEARRRLR